MKNYKLIKLNILTTFFFVTILTLSKVLPHPPNFTPLIALIIFSSLIVKNRIMLMLMILLSLIISDIFLGIYQGFSVIYVILLFIALTVPLVFKKINLYNILFTTIYSSFIFYFFSSPIHIVFFENKKLNFESIISTYYDGFPFFVSTLTSTFIYSCIIAVILFKSNIKVNISN